MESFQYRNKEVKTTPSGSRVNLLNIENGKGSKAVILYDSSGKVKSKKVKTLKRRQYQQPHRRIFALRCNA